MRKNLQSDRGSTLIMVLGAIIVVTIMIAPLVMAMNTGHLQTLNDAHYEQANAKAESMAVVFQRLLLEDQDLMDSTEILKKWNNDFQTKFSFCANSNMSINEDSEGNPNQVAISCTSGSGPTARTSTVKFQLRFNPNSVDLPFYQEHAVVTSYTESARTAIYNDVFHAGDTPDLQPSGFMNNNYDPQRYAQEFAEYMDSYTGEIFRSRFDMRPSARAALPVPSKVTGISTVVSLPPITDGSSNGIRYAGNVSFTNKTINMLPDKTGSVEVSGHAIFENAGGDILIKGHVKAGGDINAIIKPVRNNNNYDDDDNYSNKSAKLTVKGDMLSNKNINIATGDPTGYAELIVEGDMIAKDNITINGVQKITVLGDVVAGGTITVNNGVEKSFVVEGSMSAQNIYFNANSTGMVSIGKWTTGYIPQPVEGDFKSLIAQGELKFQKMQNLRVSGDISAGSAANQFNVPILTAGGSFINSSNIVLEPSWWVWTLGNSLSVNGSISSNSPGLLSLGKSLYTTTGIAMKSAALTLGGSLLSKGPMYFEGSNQNFTGSSLQVSGDVILVNNSSLIFNSAASVLYIGGSMIATGDISFPNYFFYQPYIGKDMVSGGNIQIKQIDKPFNVGGYLMAKNNIDLQYMSEKSSYKFGGYYSGGKTSFPAAFQDSNGDETIDKGDDAISINHMPPPDPGPGRGSKIGFGSWSSGQ